MVSNFFRLFWLSGDWDLSKNLVEHNTFIRGRLIRCWVAKSKLKIRQMPIGITFVPALSIFLRWKKSQREKPNNFQIFVKKRLNIRLCSKTPLYICKTYKIGTFLYFTISCTFHRLHAVLKNRRIFILRIINRYFHIEDHKSTVLRYWGLPVKNPQLPDIYWEPTEQ